MQNPLVSIIIPVYNGSNFLRDAIDSALAQDYDNIEILVINDGSDDDGETRNISLSYHDKIRYFEKTNGGVATALNLGIQNMAGEYFSWLSHDDKYYTNKISAQINYLGQLSKRDNVILYSNFDLIDASGQVFSSSISIANPSFFRYSIITQNSLHGCTLLIPRMAFNKFGDFSVDLKTTQDYDMWFRLASEYTFVGIQQCLISGRIHNAQTTNVLKKAVIEECNLLYCRFINEIEKYEIPNYSSNSFITIGNTFYNRQFYLAAFYAYKKALSKVPFWVKPMIYLRLRKCLRKIHKVQHFLEKYLYTSFN